MESGFVQRFYHNFAALAYNQLITRIQNMVITISGLGDPQYTGFAYHCRAWFSLAQTLRPMLVQMNIALDWLGDFQVHVIFLKSYYA
jgi:hypothetical protein